MLLDEFWFGFWEYWHFENFVTWAYMNVLMMYVEKFVGMCKVCFMDMAKFLWVCAWINLWVWANFVGMKLLVMENFVAM